MAKKRGSLVYKNVIPEIYFSEPLQVIVDGFRVGAASFPYSVVISISSEHNSLGLSLCDLQIGNDLVWFYFKDGITIVVVRDLIKKIEYI